jgi:hypothetical protein
VQLATAARALPSHGWYLCSPAHLTKGTSQ